jgi:colanic acid/amylovoran biosynthesis glycosyltransferase
VPARAPRVGYVLKRYPRYSETFVVTEILAHEAAGWEIEIFSLRSPNDTHFQDALARVRAPVRYLPRGCSSASDLRPALEETARLLPGLWPALDSARGEQATEVYQAAQLAAEVRRRGLDHLHAHFATMPATVARLAARMAGVPYSFTAHAKDIFHETVRPEDFGRKLQDAAAVVTVSDFNLRHLREAYGAAAARACRIYNGLDLEQFPYQPPRARPARVVAVGRLVEKKGFLDLVEACALLVRSGWDLTAVIVGEGELEPELRCQIDRQGLAARVRLLGPRPQAEIVHTVQEAAVLAAPCVVGSDGNRDGLPTTLLEAMALGTPCVSTDVTGIPEVVRHGQTGLIVPQYDPTALATTLARLLGDPELRVALAARARHLIEEEFDSRTNSARLRDVFAGACEASRVAGRAG